MSDRAQDRLHAYELRTEYVENPLAVGTTAPRLSWKLDSDGRAKKQSAYRIQAAGSRDLLRAGKADLWDSGKTASDEMVNITYDGEPLSSRQRVYWRVRVWDEDGNASDWSRPAAWSTGLLHEDDWNAEWIGFPQDDTAHVSAEELALPAAPYMRTSLRVDGDVERATLYASALGLYEARLNGERIGDDYFTPGWTDYHKRVYYNAYDVTDQLISGDNVMGGILADGWYAGYLGFMVHGRYAKPRGVYGEHPAFMAQLEIEYADGRTETIVTDGDWKAAVGPIKEADILMGTTYDARDEMPGWDAPNFDDAGWSAAVELEPKRGTVEAYPGTPVKRTQVLTPVDIWRQGDAFVVDMGQNFAGRVRLHVNGERGREVVLRFAEMLHADGSIMTQNLRDARATDTYILRGGGEEVFEPPFTYHGFRYVEVTGYPGTLGPEDISGIVMHSGTPIVSSLETSDPLVNKLYENIIWSQRSNFLEVPTDCPQRDERLGWTGDVQVFARTAAYNADVAAFFKKWLVDLNDDQYPRDHRLQVQRGEYLEVEDMPHGAYPTFAPQPYSGGLGYAQAWSDAGIIVPYEVYRAYGDTRNIEQHFDDMEEFMAFLGRLSKNGIVPGYGNNYGDWLAVGAATPRDTPTPKDLIATAYHAYDARLMAEMADAIGRSDRAAHYRDVFDRVKVAFNRAFVDENGRIEGDTQTAYAMAIGMDLLSDADEKSAGRRLAELIDLKGGLTTGFVGVSWLLPALSETGRNDIAYRLLTSTEYPSWGYSIVNGATTTWERWNSYTKEDGFMDAKMNSFNHYAFGSVGSWMFGSMAGIDTQSPGFKNLTLKPQINGDLDFVRAAYGSVHGPIETSWEIGAMGLTYEVSIPPNTTATVHVPADDPSTVREVLADGEGVRRIGVKDGRTLFAIGSGRFRFVSDRTFDGRIETTAR